MTETLGNSNLGDLLKSIRDNDLNKRTYATIIKYIEAEGPLKSSDLKILKMLCLREYNKKNSFSILSLKVISCLLKKIELQREPSDLDELGALLVAVFNNLKCNASVEKICALKVLCFEIIMSFPDECLVMAAVDYPNVLYTVVEHYSQEPSIDLVKQPLILILKLLKILPAAQRTKFVEDGISTWFGFVIPTIFVLAKDTSLELNVPLTLLDILSIQLVEHNYFENEHWKNFLSNILLRYVPIISNVLANNQDHWALLWISSVNFLKGGLTGPILNALLQVEEKAFKMSQQHRCLAFKCWNSFIENFSSQSRRILNRRLKFLAVPLLSYNAKCEEIALAKFGTWWHFFTTLWGKCDSLAEFIEPFLTFCFGSPPPTNQQFAPGMFSSQTKRLGVQALAYIFGPCGCSHSGELRPLETSLVSAEHLLQNDKNWFHYFRTALEVCVKLEDEEMSAHLKCAWKSYLLLTSGLPGDTLREKQMVCKSLNILQASLQKCCFKTSQMVIDELIAGLFELDEPSLSTLALGDAAMLESIQDILTDPCNNNFYLSCDLEATTQKIGPFADFAIANSRNVALDRLLEKLPSSESGVLLWSCFVESTMRRRHLSNSRWILDVTMWPIKQNIVSKVQRYSATWIRLYDFLDREKVKNETNTNIIHTVNDQLLLVLYGKESASTPLRLTSIICLIKQDFNERGADHRKPEHLVLKILAKQVNEDLVTPATYAHLLDCLKLLFDVFAIYKDTVGVKKLLLVTNTALKASPKVLSAAKHDDRGSLQSLEALLKSILNLTLVKEYSKASSGIAEGMKRLALFALEQASVPARLRKAILQINVHLDSKDVAAVDRRASPSKNAPKSVSIVNTVLEDGEEFVQIESNWRFNPKKLTEHQKERLQRKREDIPALYQDLSQSQDDFSSKRWKSDSNDTSSSSKSTNAIASTVPFDQTSQRRQQRDSAFASPKPPASSDGAKGTSSPKADHPNSPRIPLRDRVSRNVKSLKETSSLSQHVTRCVVVCQKLPEQMKAAASKPTDENPLSPAVSDCCNAKNGDRQNTGTNVDALKSTAPSSLSRGRPIRAKSTPRKYRDSTIFEITKSIDDTHSSDNMRVTDENSETVPKTSEKKTSRIDRQLTIDRAARKRSVAGVDTETHATRTKAKRKESPPPDSQSQDIIESSQASSIAAISATSAKSNAHRVTLPSLPAEDVSGSYEFEDSVPALDAECQAALPENDTALPQNGTTEDAAPASGHAMHSRADLTEQLDTQLVDGKFKFSETELTKNTAEADTQIVQFTVDVIKQEVYEALKSESALGNPSPLMLTKIPEVEPSTDLASSGDGIPTKELDDASSPLRDSEEKRRAFLNDTLEISPIRTMSPPLRERTPSPERSDDYLVVNLTSPVLPNGEPANPDDSPEVFTEDTRDVSPPRRGDASGPKASLEMLPRGRPNGRAAQMLGLCVDSGPAAEASTPVKRNLRPAHDADSSDEADDSEPFLRLKRHLPALTNSPVGSILKRKHAEIAEDCSPSPAGKRKRVSFHDPPVSTSVCVKKYIAPCGVRSPQGSLRRPDRLQLRPHDRSPKSQRRLDTVLAKTVESLLAESPDVAATPASLSARTPTAEVVDLDELDDSAPIFARLVNCTDPVHEVASDLSSPDTRQSLLEAFEGKITTVGDLARLTELEVNRLCIRSPKIEAAKRALRLHWTRSEAKAERLLRRKETADTEAQTEARAATSSCTQTDAEARAERTVQTETSGDVIRRADVADYINANPEVLSALNGSSVELLTRLVLTKLVEDKETMAEVLVKLFKENFETNHAVSFWCDILRKMTHRP